MIVKGGEKTFTRCKKLSQYKREVAVLPDGIVLDLFLYYPKPVTDFKSFSRQFDFLMAELKKVLLVKIHNNMSCCCLRNRLILIRVGW